MGQRVERGRNVTHTCSGEYWIQDLALPSVLLSYTMDVINKSYRSCKHPVLLTMHR